MKLSNPPRNWKNMTFFNQRKVNLSKAFSRSSNVGQNEAKQQIPFLVLASAFMFRINSVVIMETNDFSPSQQEKWWFVPFPTSLIILENSFSCFSTTFAIIITIYRCSSTFVINVFDCIRRNLKSKLCVARTIV